MKCVYIHIPFCNNICSYCDFTKFYYNKKYINDYLNNLEKEIISRYKEEPIDTIYLGGGTPSSLDVKELKRLLTIITIFKKKKKIEYTMECNVDSLNQEKIKLMKEYGINRVSLGVQSFNDNILLLLNRKHTKKDVFRVVDLLKKEGIYNINIDLMYAVNSDINIIKQDIASFLELDIPHLSYYSLIIEEHTILYNNDYSYINEDIDYEMYKYIENKLESNNYLHYEISNYAKEGYSSIHNLNYWNNGEYYGFGLSSVSYLDNIRITNTKNLTKYLKGNYLDNEEYEDIQLRKKTDLILGLRTQKGICLTEYYLKYKENVTDSFNLDTLIKEGKLIIENNYLRINKNYLYLENEILLNFF